MMHFPYSMKVVRHLSPAVTKNSHDLGVHDFSVTEEYSSSQFYSKGN